MPSSVILISEWASWVNLWSCDFEIGELREHIRHVMKTPQNQQRKFEVFIFKVSLQTAKSENYFLSFLLTIRNGDDSFVCFGAKPDKGFWTWILAVTRSGRGREKRVEKGADRQLATGHGQRRSTRDSREARQHEMGSSDSEKDRVKICRHSSCFVEFSLVIHASVSPYVLSEM